MSNQCLLTFWNKCEDRLKHYTNLFNIDMSSKGFHIQYKVMDKSPIAICYTLILTHQEQIEHRVDVLLASKHISHEIIFSIRQLLRVIQD